MEFSITGNIVDVFDKRIYPGVVRIKDGQILSVEPREEAVYDQYILPGFVDSHVHIESSMLVPSEFAKMAVVHGTVATVNDPHEIANVCGMSGVEYMINNGNTVPFKFNFGAPSCVPATVFETAGGTISVEDIKGLLARKEIRYLAEMMNFPGVLNGDPEVMQKIKAAHDAGKPVDGHAPGLRGDDAKKYITALTFPESSPLPPGSPLSPGRPKGGFEATDHECFTRNEALDKLQYGMKILIREGSAAKNFEALIDLLDDHPDRMMFCSDDKHPDNLLLGHINQLCARAVAKGIDIFKVLAAACVNPVLHYKLDVGLLRPGDPADFIVVKDLSGFQVLETYIDGKKVANRGQSFIKTAKAPLINNFEIGEKSVEEFAVHYTGALTVPVIEALDGQLITTRIDMIPGIENGLLVSDTSRDILKIVVVNRYAEAPVATGFIRNFGLKSGALASSVAHDSHNIVAVGADDESLCKAVNLVILSKGGISAVGDNREMLLSLPVGGIMSNENGYEVAQRYTDIDLFAKELGCTLQSPFMTLSFMALLVIPELKMSDKGLFDGKRFEFV